MESISREYLKRVKKSLDNERERLIRTEGQEETNESSVVYCLSRVSRNLQNVINDLTLLNMADVIQFEEDNH